MSARYGRYTTRRKIVFTVYRQHAATLERDRIIFCTLLGRACARHRQEGMGGAWASAEEDKTCGDSTGKRFDGLGAMVAGRRPARADKITTCDLGFPAVCKRPTSTTSNNKLAITAGFAVRAASVRRLPGVPRAHTKPASLPVPGMSINSLEPAWVEGAAADRRRQRA